MNRWYRANPLLPVYAMGITEGEKLISDFLTLQRDEIRQMQSYVPKLQKVLPSAKIARYLQIENKIRAIMKYELADAIPLVPDKR